MAKIKTLSFEEACKKTGHDVNNCLPYQNGGNQDQEAYNALKRLEIYFEAYNMVGKKKWVPDWSDQDQEKWRAWFIYDKSLSAFRFSYTTYVSSTASTVTGSRHVARTSDISEHVATAHIEDFNKWLLM